MSDTKRVTKIRRAILQVEGGASFNNALQEAFLISFNNMINVTFEFNGKTYNVEPNELMRIVEEKGYE